MPDEASKFDVHRGAALISPEFAATVERLGYATLWIGGSPGGDLQLVEDLLDATTRLRVATGIVNIWRDEPQPIAAAYHRIEAKHPGRFILGVGVGHREADQARYMRPYEALVSYLDALDAAGVPVQGRALAALGPRVLKLSADRSAGAYPYLVTPEHTRRARAILGDGVLLVPEQKVVVEADPVRARAIGRPAVQTPYLGLSNYTNNLRSLGYTDEDLAGAGSDKLIDDLVVYGEPAAIVAGLRRHLDAGADRVAVNLLTPAGADPVPGLTTLAGVLFG